MKFHWGQWKLTSHGVLDPIHTWGIREVSPAHKTKQEPMAQSHLSDISSPVTSLEGAIYFEILVNISSVLSQNSCESKLQRHFWGKHTALGPGETSITVIHSKASEVLQKSHQKLELFVLCIHLDISAKIAAINVFLASSRSKISLALRS